MRRKTVGGPLGRRGRLHAGRVAGSTAHWKSFAAAALASLAWSHAAGAAEFVVTHTANAGPGSLRQAIVDANTSPGADRIAFAIPGSGVQTIDVSNEFLPPITDAVTIDGYSQSGSTQNTLTDSFDANVLIHIDGGDARASSLSAPQSIGLSIQAPDCTVRGLKITRFVPFTFGHGGGGRAGGFGILVNGARCVIEGNVLSENREAGVRVAATDYLIGGTSAAARNLISGNAIGVRAGPSERGRIAGNLIGRYTTGTPGNSRDVGTGNSIGIVLTGVLTQTVVGGIEPGARNIISGNQVGIRTGYTNPGTQQTEVARGAVVQGNLVGARSLPPYASSNHTGIELLGLDHQIGGLVTAAGNIISSNRYGIRMDTVTSPQAERNTIIGNEIAANVETGVSVYGTDHRIGGLEEGAGNRLAYNHVAVAITGGAQSERNRILSNKIEGNGTLTPLDLGRDGLTMNDAGDSDTGENRRQNFPTITDVRYIGGNTVITAALSSTPSSSFTVQTFAEPTGTPGQLLLDTRTVSTDAHGRASFEVVYPRELRRDTVAATATDGDGNTSELSPREGPVQLANISTRGIVGQYDFYFLIGGFIIDSAAPKKVAIRGLGPSLNVPNRLPDPYLELYDNSGTLIAKNDDWRSGDQQELAEYGLAPSSELESALIATLPSGAYTAQLREREAGSQPIERFGVGLVEIYDLDPFPAAAGRLMNISTRGLVGFDADALIGGLIIRGAAGDRVGVRAIGPDLDLNGALPDPTLELIDANGALIDANDNWRDEQEQDIVASGLAPRDSRNSAMIVSLAPGSYTAVVRGKAEQSGVALVEFYDLTNAGRSAAHR